jgi:hypothetical protein
MRCLLLMVHHRRSENARRNFTLMGWDESETPRG